MKKIMAILLLSVFAILITSCSSPEYYIVKFETGGGSAFLDVTVKEGESINLDDYNPTREGSIFMGWSSQEDFELQSDSIQIIYEEGFYSPNSDITLTAIYMNDSTE